jgi:L,D-transpeptidase catalytic domain
MLSKGQQFKYRQKILPQTQRIMKPQVLLITLACTIAATGCSTSQAQGKVKSSNLQTNSGISNPVGTAIVPSPEPGNTRTEISKSSVETDGGYKCNRTANHLFLGNGTQKNRYKNPIYTLHLCVAGKELKSYEIVTGRSFTQKKNRNQSGTHSPLPNGKYRMNSALTQGMVVEVGRVNGLNVSQPFLPITPLFSTGRSALGIHVDPSYNKDPKEDGTSGCIGLTNAEDFRSLWSEIKHYQIKDLQVAINTTGSNNPDVADRRIDEN